MHRCCEGLWDPVYRPHMVAGVMIVLMFLTAIARSAEFMTWRGLLAVPVVYSCVDDVIEHLRTRVRRRSPAIGAPGIAT